MSDPSGEFGKPLENAQGMLIQHCQSVTGYLRLDLKNLAPGEEDLEPC